MRYQFVDQGLHDYRLWLVLHRGGWRSAGLERLAKGLVNQPPLIREAHHEGGLPPVESFVQIGPENVNGMVLKRAEKSFEDSIIRFYETTGEPARAFVRSERFGWHWEGDIGPCEIKTLRIDAAGRAWETDMLEEIPEAEPKGGEAERETTSGNSNTRPSK